MCAPRYKQIHCSIAAQYFYYYYYYYFQPTHDHNVTKWNLRIAFEWGYKNNQNMQWIWCTLWIDGTCQSRIHNCMVLSLISFLVCYQQEMHKNVTNKIYIYIRSKCVFMCFLLKIYKIIWRSRPTITMCSCKNDMSTEWDCGISYSHYWTLSIASVNFA